MKHQTQALTAFLAKTLVFFVLLYLPLSNLLIGIAAGAWGTIFYNALVWFVRHAKATEKRLVTRIRIAYNANA